MTAHRSFSKKIIELDRNDINARVVYPLKLANSSPEFFGAVETNGKGTLSVSGIHADAAPIKSAVRRQN